MMGERGERESSVGLRKAELNSTDRLVSKGLPPRSHTSRVVR